VPGVNVTIWTNLITGAATATAALGSLLIRGRQDQAGSNRESARLAASELIRAARALELHYERVVMIDKQTTPSRVIDAVDEHTVALAADLSQAAVAAEMAFPPDYEEIVGRVSRAGQTLTDTYREAAGRGILDPVLFGAGRPLIGEDIAELALAVRRFIGMAQRYLGLARADGEGIAGWLERR